MKRTESCSCSEAPDVAQIPTADGGTFYFKPSKRVSYHILVNQIIILGRKGPTVLKAIVAEAFTL